MSLGGIIIWLIVGGIIGWLASLIMRTDAQQGIILNIVVGIIGSIIAGLLFHPSGALEGFLYSLVGAVILLAIVNLLSRGRLR
jgi:uncharacterized membrane protein YeaQ/YmgE (transglycosylase-associated protein family)